MWRQFVSQLFSLCIASLTASGGLQAISGYFLGLWLQSSHSPLLTALCPNFSLSIRTESSWLRGHPTPVWPHPHLTNDMGSALSPDKVPFRGTRSYDTNHPSERSRNGRKASEACPKALQRVESTGPYAGHEESHDEAGVDCKPLCKPSASFIWRVSI